MTVIAKTPGPDMTLAPVTLDFRYGEVFGGRTPEAYERLLLDVIHGDATLYARGDWVERAWDILTPVMKGWATSPPPQFPDYDAFCSGAGGDRQSIAS